jgi:hypothetical protein
MSTIAHQSVAWHLAASGASFPDFAPTHVNGLDVARLVVVDNRNLLVVAILIAKRRNIPVAIVRFVGNGNFIGTNEVLHRRIYISLASNKMHPNRPQRQRNP